MNSAHTERPTGSSRGDFVAVLLAGGRSRRMGRDKAMLELDGQPLWRHQVETLLALHPARTLIATRPDQVLGKLPDGVDVIPDGTAGAGALRALPRLLRDPLPQLPRLVTAVDMPAIDAPFLHRHFLAARGDGDAGVVLVDRQARIQPVPCLLAPGCLASADALLARGELSLRAFCRACICAGTLRTVRASTDDTARLASLNAPEDWQNFRESR